jgi:hypothetical protein
MGSKLLELQRSDENRIKRDETRHPVVKYLKEKENLSFNIGDILIKKIKKYGGPHIQDHWVTETMSAQSKVPRKYIYVHENEFGVGYIKRLKADGSGTCGPCMCLADVEYSWIRYSVDPEYSDHILLGEVDKYEYNERFKKEKELRQEIHKYNRSILVSTKSWPITNERVRLMKTGQHFWFNDSGMGIQNIQEYEYEVMGLVAVGMNQPVYDVTVKFISTGNTTIINASELIGKALTFSKPKSLKDVHG